MPRTPRSTGDRERARSSAPAIARSARSISKRGGLVAERHTGQQQAERPAGRGVEDVARDQDERLPQPRPWHQRPRERAARSGRRSRTGRWGRAPNLRSPESCTSIVGLAWAQHYPVLPTQELSAGPTQSGALPLAADSIWRPFRPLAHEAAQRPRPTKIGFADPEVSGVEAAITGRGCGGRAPQAGRWGR